jgi:ElaB/YqjD/DUF883 family membrane-anchored ribosome-binding protein
MRIAALKHSVKQEPFMTHTIAATKQLRTHDAIERLAQAAHHAVDRAAAKAEVLGETRDVWLETAGNQVRKRPLTSMLIATGVGLLIGRLMR